MNINFDATTFPYDFFQGGETIFAQLDVWKSYATCNMVGLLIWS